MHRWLLQRLAHEFGASKSHGIQKPQQIRGVAPENWQKWSLVATNGGLYDAANQLKYGQTAKGRTTCVYDRNGNQQIEIPAAGNRTTTTWNYENQPTLYRLPSGGRVTTQYNGDNRRVKLDD